MRKSVALGMSGGVDSAAAAIKLRDKGYDVTGVFIVMSDDSGLRDAQKVAEQLKIGFTVVDRSRQFKDSVINYFLAQYRNGRTPNPCTVCNPEVKFDALMSEGTDYIATGHYAGVFTDGLVWCIRKTHSKDQSYMLSRLKQDQISKLILPLDGTEKQDNRALCRENTLELAEKKDSQDICFVEKGRLALFLKENGLLSGKGEYLMDGKTVGMHEGFERYTIGQRKNLGIALGAPVYVSKIIPERNEVCLSFDDPLTTDFTCSDIVYQYGNGNEDALVKIRYAHQGAKAKLSDNGHTVKFSEPQRAVTPGQIAVSYTNDGKILCSGFID